MLRKAVWNRLLPNRWALAMHSSSSKDLSRCRKHRTASISESAVRSSKRTPVLPLDRQSFELAYVQMVEETLRVQQLLVGALLDDLSIVYHNDVVRVAYR
jgi:hypothetical protein